MDFVPFARPDFTAEEREAVNRVLDSGWLTTGPESLAFEREFAAKVGTRHALATNSATSGLHLALEALGIGPGDLVYTTPFTFTATAEIVRYVGAEVRFVDIESDTALIDPVKLDRAIAQSTGGKRAAIIPVHFGGAVCDMPAIRAIAAKYQVAVIEDAAHAFPSRTGDGYAGTLGDAGVFSFYATKPLTTGEGGMVCTESDQVADRIRLMRLHGIDREAWDRYKSRHLSWYYEVVEAGFKYNLPDILAAIGRVQLQRADELHAQRAQLAERYTEKLSGCPYLQLPPTSPGHAWHLYPVQVLPDELGADRNAVAELMYGAGLGVSVHYVPLHIMPYYAQRYSMVPSDFPVALDRYERTISLPIYPGLSVAAQDRVIDLLRSLPRLIQ